MPVMFRSTIKEHNLSLIIWPLLCAGLYLASLYSYLLFHVVAESFSIVIAFSIFMIAWNTRHVANNDYILFISIAFLFAGFIDFVHTLAFKGMNIFRGFDANIPTQLWIIARYLQSLSLFAAPWFIKHKLNSAAVIGFYISVTLFILTTVFSGILFPDCFIEGRGLTPFKIISEYVICFILILSLALLLHHRKNFDQKILQLILWSIILTIVSELAFTFYISVYGLSNLVGHYFKIFSFYLIYRAIIVTGLENPYRLVFFDLQKQREELQTIIDASPIMIFYKDLQARFVRVNKKLAEATGLPREKIEGKKDFEIYPGQETNYREDDKEVIASEKPKTGIIEPINTVSGKRWFQTDKIPYRNKEGQVIGIIGFAVEITKRKQAEEELLKEKKRFTDLSENAPFGMVLIDTKGKFIYINPKFKELFGYDSEDIPDGKAWFEKAYPDAEYRKKVIEIWLEDFQQVKSKQKSSRTFKVICKDGTEKIIIFSPVQLETGEYIISCNDITEQKHLEDQLHTMSLTDELTGLYNRRGFITLSEKQLKIAERTKKDTLLFFADLDKMKHINDTLGHQEGDRALIEVATILKEVFRESDIIGRMGGDEFAILAIDTSDKTREVLLKRLYKTLDDYNRLEGRKYTLSLSIGVSQYDSEKPSSLDEIIAGADSLMYEQKRKNK